VSSRRVVARLKSGGHVTSATIAAPRKCADFEIELVGEAANRLSDNTGSTTRVLDEVEPVLEDRGESSVTVNVPAFPPGMNAGQDHGCMNTLFPRPVFVVNRRFL
jgi:hypothetical protein